MDSSFKSIPRFEIIFLSPIVMTSTTLLMAFNRNALIFSLPFIFCDCIAVPAGWKILSLDTHMACSLTSFRFLLMWHLFSDTFLTTFSVIATPLHTAQPVLLSFIAININIFIVTDINISFYVFLMNFIFLVLQQN